MPTTKPRITITLTEHQHALLQTLSGYQGESMSSIIVDLLETALPVLERIAVIMKAASEAPQEMLVGLRGSLERAEANVLNQMQEHMGQLDIFLQEAGGGVGGARALPAPSPASAPSPTKKKPPTSNRGVRITATSPSSPMKTGVLQVSTECTCTHTKHERMENKKCPVHFPAKRRRHEV
jgi:hypothetical protein